VWSSSLITWPNNEFRLTAMTSRTQGRPVRSTTCVFLTSLRLDRYDLYYVEWDVKLQCTIPTGPIFLLVLSHFARIMWFLISTFIGRWLRKPTTRGMPYADWIHCLNVTRHGLTSDARSTQIFSLRIFI